MGKSIVWLDDEIAGKVEILQDIIKLRGEEIDKVIQELADDTRNLTTDNLDTLLLEMKLHARKVRDTYKQAVDEEIENTEKLWEECDEKINSSRTNITKVKNSFCELNDEINKLNSGINRMNLYKLEQAIDLLDRFKAYSDVDKKKIEMLLKYNEE